MESGSRDYCPYHPDEYLIQDYRRGDQICNKCGLVVGDRIIDSGGEWRTFNSERAGPEQSRVGGAENPFSSGQDLTTVVRGSDDTPIFKRADKRKGRYGYNLNEDEIISDAVKLMEQIGEQCHLPKTLQTDACNKFQEIHNKKIFTMYSKTAIATACLYISCRQGKLPRSIREICNPCNTSTKKLGKCIRLVEKTLPISLIPSTAADLIPRFCSNLKLSKSLENAAVVISNNATDLDLVTGRSILATAGASIYLASQASNDPRTMIAIAEMVGISVATIKVVYKMIYAQAENLFPDDFDFHTPIHELPLN